MKVRLCAMLLPIAVVTSSGCGGGSTTTRPAAGEHALSLVTPPVKAATPPALRPPTSGLALAPGRTALTTGLAAMSAADFQSRFFSTGPTAVFDLLASID